MKNKSKPKAAIQVFFQKIKRLAWKLIRLNNSPRQIAFGVAVGVFIGVTPLYGMHTLLALFAALLIPRTNKIAILAGTNITIAPLAPLISWAGYSLGCFILRNPQYPPLSWEMIKALRVDSVTFLYYPLFLGSLVLGFFLAFIFFFIVLVIVKKMRRRKRAV
ncbi:MAG: DUF2062 domain-containing protein [Candidatus Omnitrophota bacterium]